MLKIENLKVSIWQNAILPFITSQGGVTIEGTAFWKSITSSNEKRRENKNEHKPLIHVDWLILKY